MKLETFFEKFDELADTPDGVKKMRELVLRLATTGHLIPTDGSGWANVALNEIASARMGKTILKSELSDAGIPVYSAGRENTAWGFIAASDLTFHTGTILVSARGTIGFPKIPAEPEFISTQTTIAITPTSKEIDSGYFCLQLQTVDWDDLTAKTAIPMITVKQVHAIEVRYPHSLAEQKRIVAKVDELMALCDRLEAQQQERETRHAALARASLARFADAPTPANLPFLFHPSYAIPPADLRKSILTLAVQGKLVPQDPNDEPAENKVGRNEKLSADAPFEIPEQWMWTQLSQLADINGGFAFKSTAYTDEGTRVVRISDFDEFGFKDHKVVRHPFSSELQKFTLAESNILMAMTGGTVGKSYFVTSLPEPMVVNQRVATIKVSVNANPSYVDIAIRSEMTQEVIRTAKNSTNDNISMGDIKGFAIPLPPLAEQRRIVAKVEQLMALVDALETQLAASRATAANLLSALVAELTTQE